MDGRRYTELKKLEAQRSYVARLRRGLVLEGARLAKVAWEPEGVQWPWVALPVSELKYGDEEQ